MAVSGHFLGNHSVLEILRQEGYEVEHTPAQEPITGSWTEVEGITLTPSGVSPELVTDWVSEAPELEEDLPHLLLPESLNQLEEFGRHQRPRKAHRPHSRQRLFSDLWVRIGDSTTPTPNIRITNDYMTVESPLTRQEQQQRRRMSLNGQQQTPPLLTTALAPPSPSCALPALLTCFLSQLLLTS